MFYSLCGLGVYGSRGWGFHGLGFARKKEMAEGFRV